MVVFDNCEGDDRLTLTTDDIEERPVTTWWTRSRYVTVLSVAGCLLTSLAVVTTVSLYWTLNNETIDKHAKQNVNKDQGECHYILVAEIFPFMIIDEVVCRWYGGHPRRKDC